ncbi:AraC-like DNA-binding protein [Nocardiopsis arvandica]|uniref:AraC-like DNA-binding protein n=1 Tax=Nocardiopsis sinuspersici TaxID=501010 RepID=A0A7Y9X7U7_9ACTN|nr:AraC family transcriptional regulator [Nocardiopsis sinuspersici]NYH50603.1 AraC-like DNA-binding protein [Nocardiopsis sinuspersici]
MKVEESVRRATEIIRNRYSESITLNKIAAEVFVSPYHFSRIFSRDVGLTPGRYLTAVRLFAAKRLLLTTGLTVSDIVCSVGYNSVGTFTSRFTRLVGMSPTQYRDPAVSRLFVAASHDFSRMPDLGEMVAANRCRLLPKRYTATLRGAIEVPRAAGVADAVVCVFSEAAPQRSPVAFQALSVLGRAEFEVSGIPSGSHYLLAMAAPRGRRPDASGLTAVTRRHIRTEPGLSLHVGLSLQSPEVTDPPVAVTLADASALVGDGALGQTV